MQHLKKLEALGGKEKGAVDLGSAATAEEMNAIQKFLKKFESYEESIRFLSVVGQVKGGLFGWLSFLFLFLFFFSFFLFLFLFLFSFSFSFLFLSPQEKKDGVSLSLEII